ncbi:hypothetical protein D5S17_32420 [Pseudonocardiaceae bacterium YIM PH 21723]|nr:hypothetical protein D5S17_32420 [Pseudonocardiaceae bacterium YIM PH 21723]
MLASIPQFPQVALWLFLAALALRFSAFALITVIAGLTAVLTNNHRRAQRALEVLKITERQSTLLARLIAHLPKR